jgi:hypothetical protein
VSPAPGLVDEAVDTALADGSIIRTHILRPTWHFVLPADLRWIMQLTAPRILARFASAPGGLGWPTPAGLERGYDLFREVLSGGREQTRVELAALLIERGVVATKQETIAFFMRGELDLVLVSGGLRGRVHTYALASERVPAAPAVFDRDLAVVDLARRYFTSHGPATIADFGWWSSLNVGDIRAGLAALEANGELERIDIDGTDYWWGGDRFPAAVDDPSPTVHLMQAYDEYIVAHRAPRTPINVSGSPVVGSGMNRPPFLHAVILDGQLVGWWRRESGRELNRAQRRALDDAVERYSEFVGLPAHVETT